MKIELYSCDYSDYSWYCVCKDLELVTGEYEEGGEHTKYWSMTAQVSSLTAIRIDKRRN